MWMSIKRLFSQKSFEKDFRFPKNRSHQGCRKGRAYTRFRVYSRFRTNDSRNDVWTLSGLISLLSAWRLTSSIIIAVLVLYSTLDNTEALTSVPLLNPNDNDPRDDGIVRWWKLRELPFDNNILPRERIPPISIPGIDVAKDILGRPGGHPISDSSNKAGIEDKRRIDSVGDAATIVNTIGRNTVSIGSQLIVEGDPGNSLYEDSYFYHENSRSDNLDKNLARSRRSFVDYSSDKTGSLQQQLDHLIEANYVWDTDVEHGKQTETEDAPTESAADPEHPHKRTSYNYWRLNHRFYTEVVANEGYPFFDGDSDFHGLDKAERFHIDIDKKSEKLDEKSGNLRVQIYCWKPVTEECVANDAAYNCQCRDDNLWEYCIDDLPPTKVKTGPYWQSHLSHMRVKMIKRMKTYHGMNHGGPNAPVQSVSQPSTSSKELPKEIRWATDHPTSHVVSVPEIDQALYLGLTSDIPLHMATALPVCYTNSLLEQRPILIKNTFKNPKNIEILRNPPIKEILKKNPQLKTESLVTTIDDIKVPVVNYNVRKRNTPSNSQDAADTKQLPKNGKQLKTPNLPRRFRRFPALFSKRFHILDDRDVQDNVVFGTSQNFGVHLSELSGKYWGKWVFKKNESLKESESSKEGNSKEGTAKDSIIVTTGPRHANRQDDTRKQSNYTSQSQSNTVGMSDDRYIYDSSVSGDVLRWVPTLHNNPVIATFVGDAYYGTKIRTVVCMSTIPKRMPYIKKNLEALLLHQQTSPDHVYLTVPLHRRVKNQKKQRDRIDIFEAGKRRDCKREGFRAHCAHKCTKSYEKQWNLFREKEKLGLNPMLPDEEEIVNVPASIANDTSTHYPKHLPDWMQQMQRDFVGRFTVIRPEVDRGPGTRLFEVLKVERDHRTYLLLIDDDIIAAPNFVALLVRSATANNGKALGFLGFVSTDTKQVRSPLRGSHLYQFRREVTERQMSQNIYFDRKPWRNQVTRDRRYAEVLELFKRVTDFIVKTKGEEHIRYVAKAFVSQNRKNTDGTAFDKQVGGSVDTQTDANPILMPMSSQTDTDTLETDLESDERFAIDAAYFYGTSVDDFSDLEDSHENAMKFTNDDTYQTGDPYDPEIYFSRSFYESVKQETHEKNQLMRWLEDFKRVFDVPDAFLDELARSPAYMEMLQILEDKQQNTGHAKKRSVSDHQATASLFYSAKNSTVGMDEAFHNRQNENNGEVIWQPPPSKEQLFRELLEYNATGRLPNGRQVRQIPESSERSGLGNPREVQQILEKALSTDPREGALNLSKNPPQGNGALISPSDADTESRSEEKKTDKTVDSESHSEMGTMASQSEQIKGKIISEMSSATPVFKKMVEISHNLQSKNVVSHTVYERMTDLEQEYHQSLVSDSQIPYDTRIFCDHGGLASDVMAAAGVNTSAALSDGVTASHGGTFTDTSTNSGAGGNRTLDGGPTGKSVLGSSTDSPPLAILGRKELPVSVFQSIGFNGGPILAAYQGVIYRRGFFDFRIFELLEECTFTDDMWISAHLALRGIRRSTTHSTPLNRRIDDEYGAEVGAKLSVQRYSEDRNSERETDDTNQRGATADSVTENSSGVVTAGSVTENASGVAATEKASVVKNEDWINVVAGSESDLNVCNHAIAELIKPDIWRFRNRRVLFVTDEFTLLKKGLWKYYTLFDQIYSCRLIRDHYLQKYWFGKDYIDENSMDEDHIIDQNIAYATGKQWKEAKRRKTAAARRRKTEAGIRHETEAAKRHETDARMRHEIEASMRHETAADQRPQQDVEGASVSKYAAATTQTKRFYYYVALSFRTRDIATAFEPYHGFLRRHGRIKHMQQEDPRLSAVKIRISEDSNTPNNVKFLPGILAFLQILNKVIKLTRRVNGCQFWELHSQVDYLYNPNFRGPFSSLYGQAYRPFGSIHVGHGSDDSEAHLSNLMHQELEKHTIVYIYHGTDIQDYWYNRQRNNWEREDELYDEERIDQMIDAAAESVTGSASGDDQPTATSASGGGGSNGQSTPSTHLSMYASPTPYAYHQKQLVNRWGTSELRNQQVNQEKFHKLFPNGINMTNTDIKYRNWKYYLSRSPDEAHPSDAEFTSSRESFQFQQRLRYTKPDMRNRTTVPLDIEALENCLFDLQKGNSWDSYSHETTWDAYTRYDKEKCVSIGGMAIYSEYYWIQNQRVRKRLGFDDRNS